MKIVLAVILILCLLGCNLFEPREADEPRQPAEWHPFQTTPEKCLDNLVFAFNYIENGWKYSSVLSSQFEFHFDPQDRIDFTLPVSWDRVNEIEMLRNAHARLGIDGIELELSKIDGLDDLVQANNARFFRRYVLLVYMGDDGFSRNYTGKMELYMESEFGLWVVRQWSDFRDDSEWTWGRMKDEFGV